MKKQLGLFALLALALLTGCTGVRVYDHERGAGFSCIMPAWPWQDSSAVLDRMTVSSKTNAFTASVKGLTQTETTSTNATDLAGQIVTSAVKAALTIK